MRCDQASNQIQAPVKGFLGDLDLTIQLLYTRRFNNPLLVQVAQGCLVGKVIGSTTVREVVALGDSGGKNLILPIVIGSHIRKFCSIGFGIGTEFIGGEHIQLLTDL